MITVTLQEAKAKLNKLVDLTLEGEQVVLMRGAKIVATLMPLSANDLELSSQLTDTQAERFWQEVKQSNTKSFSSSKQAVEFLKRK